MNDRSSRSGNGLDLCHSIDFLSLYMHDVRARRTAGAWENERQRVNDIDR
jgi:hypothetical protein